MEREVTCCATMVSGCVANLDRVQVREIGEVQLLRANGVHRTCVVSMNKCALVEAETDDFEMTATCKDEVDLGIMKIIARSIHRV